MLQKSIKLMWGIAIVGLMGCTTPGGSSDVQAGFEVTQATVSPGTSVKIDGKKINLYPGSLRVGDVIKKTLADYDSIGKVAIVNIVPSVDTPVCEAQTHELGESPNIPADIARVTVSRDLPMAQSRFAKEAKLTNIKYISDYKHAHFGKKSGLLMQGPELLARGVLVVDKKGVIRHVQIVPDVVQLPDLKKAIDIARKYR